MRESQQRTVQDAAAARREVARLTTAEAEAVAERDRAAAEHSTEVQHLQHEAQQASLAAEINSAKAAQYDNIAAHMHRVEEELRQMREQEPARLEAEQLAASVMTKLKVCTSALSKQALLWDQVHVQCSCNTVCVLPLA